MPGPGHTVEDNPLQVQLRVQCTASKNQRRCGPRHFGSVYNQYHRRFKQLGQFGSAVTPLDINTIEDTAIAFYNRNILAERSSDK